MIIEDYVSFETAKLLKEKGFDEATYRAYIETNKEHQLSFDVGRNNSQWEKINKEDGIFNCSAPTLQMAMKWLRKVHKIVIAISFQYDKFYQPYYFYKIANIGKKEDWNIEKSEHITVEEATEAAIKYCLENLI